MSIEPINPQEIPSPTENPGIQPIREPGTPIKPGKEPEIPPTPEPYIPEQPDELPSEDED